MYAKKKHTFRQSETTDYSTAKKKKKVFPKFAAFLFRHCQYYVAGIVHLSSRILGVNRTTALESVIRWDRNT